MLLFSEIGLNSLPYNEYKKEILETLKYKHWPEI
jgi:hypothetical protein